MGSSRTATQSGPDCAAIRLLARISCRQRATRRGRTMLGDLFLALYHLLSALAKRLAQRVFGPELRVDHLSDAQRETLHSMRVDRVSSRVWMAVALGVTVLLPAAVLLLVIFGREWPWILVAVVVSGVFVVPVAEFMDYGWHRHRLVRDLIRIAPLPTCPTCGYDCRHTPSLTCPECGTKVRLGGLPDVPG